MPQIEAQTSSGTVRGDLNGGIVAFKGIPFAQPPFGPNLFKLPVYRRPAHEPVVRVAGVVTVPGGDPGVDGQGAHPCQAAISCTLPAVGMPEPRSRN